jgi:hypothetical protein
MTNSENIVGHTTLSVGTIEVIDFEQLRSSWHRFSSFNKCQFIFTVNEQLFVIPSKTTRHRLLFHRPKQRNHIFQVRNCRKLGPGNPRHDGFVIWTRSHKRGSRLLCLSYHRSRRTCHKYHMCNTDDRCCPSRSLGERCVLLLMWHGVGIVVGIRFEQWPNESRLGPWYLQTNVL